MPRKKVDSEQLRFTVPQATAERLRRLAEPLGVDLPTLIRFMVAGQLVQWEAMYLHPGRIQTVVEAADALVLDVADAAAEQLAGGRKPAKGRKAA
jgi:hypothetical protein